MTLLKFIYVTGNLVFDNYCAKASTLIVQGKWNAGEIVKAHFGRTEQSTAKAIIFLESVRSWNEFKFLNSLYMSVTPVDKFLSKLIDSISRNRYQLSIHLLNKNWWAFSKDAVEIIMEAALWAERCFHLVINSF